MRLLILAIGLVICPPAQPASYPGKAWESRKSGWSAEKLREARKYADSVHSAAVMVVEDGRVVDQWGDTAHKYMCHSMRKSFLSALYGIYVNEGRIDLALTLEKLGIDDNEPALNSTEKKATIRQLLQARSGIYHPALYETPGMKAARPARGSHLPGTFWYYNNWDFNALGTIFEKLTGAKIFEDLKRRIMDPIGAEDFNLQDCCEYFRGEDSIHPAYPMRISTRDLARFGLLFLREGNWKGHEIVPKAWVRESTMSYSDAGRAGGYGYMWWVAANGRHLPDVTLPDGSYSARGAGGHFILVIPARKLVIVHRADTDAPQPVSDAAFGKLVKMILDARNSPESSSRRDERASLKR